MRTFQRIGIYCGSRHGRHPAYTQAAQTMGTLLAQRGIGIVYGGGCVGLMGEVADAALRAGGEVIGVIPQALEEKEVAHRGLTELHVVPNMHIRKMKMLEMADACISLPGGWGTIEELSEALTWNQLALHDKPVGLLNTEGYYDALLSFFSHAEHEGFLPRSGNLFLQVEADPHTLLQQLHTVQSLI